MRKLFTLAIGIISSHFGNAQFAENNAIYLTEEINIGNYFGADLNINYVLKEKYAFKIGYNGGLRKPKLQPEDFNIGMLNTFLFFGTRRPIDGFESVGISAGRICKLNQSGTIRANLSMGIDYTFIQQAENWQKIEQQALPFKDNYTYDYVNYKTISLVINPKIEFPITRYFGFTVSPMLQINKETTYVGIGFGTMFGLLRKDIYQNKKLDY